MCRACCVRTRWSPIFYAWRVDGGGGKLGKELDGCPAHGVPFTAEISGEGLLSWGVDPPESKQMLSWQPQESWRLWLTNRLANALLTARRANSASGPEPWRYALERLGLEGIDTESWTPAPGSGKPSHRREVHMPITDRFILPGDVLLMPVSELPETIRAKVTHKEGDLAITRPHLRTPSKIVDSQAGELLKEFETARTIVEAVLNFSERRKADPHRILEEALPLLQNFIDSHILVPPDSPEAVKIEPDACDGRFVRRVRGSSGRPDSRGHGTLSGSADHGSGGDVALKIVRNTRSRDLEESFEREGAVLQHLDGKVNPALVKRGQCDGRSFLAMEWVYGVPVSLLADEIRAAANGSPDQEEIRDAHARLAKLCISLLESYAHLHEQGVLHSDVHTNNLLVNDSGEIKILDYGFARFMDTSHPLSVARRAGVSFFFEPECARAVLLGKEPPASSPAGEQYAICRRRLSARDRGKPHRLLTAQRRVPPADQ